MYVPAHNYELDLLNNTPQPNVHTMGDAGEILAGAWGREICGIAQTTFLVFVMASHVLTFSIMMNVLTDHSKCTIWFMVIGTVISFICTLPRTLKSVSHLSIASFVSVLAAIMITMIGVGIRGRPAGIMIENTTDVTFDNAFIGVMNIVFAYGMYSSFNSYLLTNITKAGHLAFFSFISEMKNPKEYPYVRSLKLLALYSHANFILGPLLFASIRYLSLLDCCCGHLLLHGQGCRFSCFRIHNPTPPQNRLRHCLTYDHNCWGYQRPCCRGMFLLAHA